MSIRKKPSIENQKQTAEMNLVARTALLKSKGWEDARISQDPKIKQFKAARREAKKRLANIAGMEAFIVAKAESKTQKQIAAKAAADQPKRKAEPVEAPKKAKKTKK